MLVSLFPLHDLNRRLLKASNDGCMRAGGGGGGEGVSRGGSERGRERERDFCTVAVPLSPSLPH